MISKYLREYVNKKKRFYKRLRIIFIQKKNKYGRLNPHASHLFFLDKWFFAKKCLPQSYLKL